MCNKINLSMLGFMSITRSCTSTFTNLRGYGASTCSLPILGFTHVIEKVGRHARMQPSTSGNFARNHETCTMLLQSCCCISWASCNTGNKLESLEHSILPFSRTNVRSGYRGKVKNLPLLDCCRHMPSNCAMIQCWLLKRRLARSTSLFTKSRGVNFI